jgi:hypothetical protein
MQAEIERQIAELEVARRSFSDSSVVLALLTALERVEIHDPALLARFHDALLFLSAYPATPKVRSRTESLLKRFARRVVALSRSGDISPLLDQKVSGIAGTSIDTDFSYEVARWLVRRFPRQIGIDPEVQPGSDRLATVLPSLLPFLEEEASADANVPYLEWLAAAGPRAQDGGLAWLLSALDRLPLSSPHRAALYDSLGLVLSWTLGNSAMTRTRMRGRRAEIFYQKGPLLSRRDVEASRQSPVAPLPVTRLSRREGEEALDLARAAITIRYRELFCFTWGDPAGILSIDGGRGITILLIGLEAERRLPLRAGFGVLLLRNGVPIGYGDAYGLCERMEVSFNIFYAFRDGESAFCFVRLLDLYHQLFGSTSFSIDPYQIGLGNDEAIEAGAFWFYRKLGFRSTDPLVERAAVRDEKRMARAPSFRTSARTLKKWALSPLIHELPGPGGDLTKVAGGWDHFRIRNLGRAVEKTFALRGVSASAFREATSRHVAAMLRIELRSLPPRQRRALDLLAPVLALIPDLKRWKDEERGALLEIIRAKAGRDEGRYLRLTARHERFRLALLKLGASR